MSTNSDRYLTQLFIESRIGCPTAEDLAGMVGSFESYAISHQDLGEIAAALSEDALALFRKGLLTFLQALVGLDCGNESWALIRLYYSTYFFLRESLANDSCAVLRCKNIYTLDISVGETPRRRTGANYRGDHQATIRLHADRFTDRDVLLSQSIDGKIPYEWLKSRRDWINYRRREFFDLGGESGFSDGQNSYVVQTALYCSDSIPIYCFDPDYAALALPVKRAQLSVLSRQDGKQFVKDCITDIKKFTRRIKSCEAFLAAL